MELGQQIKKWRKERGFTQLQLAAAIDRSHVTVEKIEQGKYKPTPTTLDRICKVLDLTYDKIELRSKC